MADPKPTKARALRFAKDAQRMLETAEQKATDMAARRDKAVGTAKATGATYAEMMAATGLSATRVTTILKRSRT
jgi:hypothetical protein